MPDITPVETQMNRTQVVSKEMTDKFNGWAAKNKFGVLMGASVDEQGRETEGLSRFNAKLSSYEVPIPSEAEWHPDIRDTKRGILFRQGVIEDAIVSMRSAAYPDGIETDEGIYKEAGGLGYGMRCVDGEILYETSFFYVPYPTEGVEIGGDASNLTFTEAAFINMVERVQDLVKKNDLEGYKMAITSWLHCHPGNARHSVQDTAVQSLMPEVYKQHRVSPNLYGLVVGDEIIRDADQPVSLERIQQSLGSGQMDLITKEGERASIGIAPKTILDHFVGVDIVAANEMPTSAREQSSLPLQRLDSKRERTVMRINLDSDQDSINDSISERKSGTIHIELAESISEPGEVNNATPLEDSIIIPSDDTAADTADIVITYDVVENQVIRISEVHQNRLEEVLDQVKILFGF